jgi:hypothetical protein
MYFLQPVISYFIVLYYHSPYIVQFINLFILLFYSVFLPFISFKLINCLQKFACLHIMLSFTCILYLYPFLLTYLTVISVLLLYFVLISFDCVIFRTGFLLHGTNVFIFDSFYIQWMNSCIWIFWNANKVEVEDCIRGLQAYPSCSVIYVSLYLAMLACGSFNWPVTSKELRQPITFEEV